MRAGIIGLIKIIKYFTSKLYIYLLILFFTIIAIFGKNNKLIQNVNISLSEFTSPILLSLNKIEKFVSNLKDLPNIRAENLKLKEENTQLKSYYQNLSQIFYENSELKNLLNFIDSYQISFVSARFINNLTGLYAKQSFITAGADNNIKKGQIVLSNMGIVGRILDVGKRTSKILNITDINSKIPIILSQSRIKAIAAGDNSELLSLQYLPIGSAVTPGELAVTSGDIEMLPANILVGYVVLDSNNNLKIKPILDISKLEFVSVIY